MASTFRYWGDDRTICVSHGKGGRTWDIGGNVYVDYRLGYGPAILGYVDDRVVAAAMCGMQVGGVIALSAGRELIVAERIAKMVPAVELAFLGRKPFQMSEGRIYEMIRFWTMCISDYLDKYFESPVIKAYLAVSAIIGTALGPMSPGSAYVLLHHYMGDVDGYVGAWGFARGGMGSISKALDASLAACAGSLAASGRKVLVLDSGPVAGGGANMVEFAPGFRVSGLAHLYQGLDARVAKGMKLDVASASEALPTTALADSGDHLSIQGASLSGGLDAEAFSALHKRLAAFAGVLAPFRALTPPGIAKGVGHDYLRLAKLGLGLRMLGKQEFREFLRMILINVADVLDDGLTDDRLKGALAFDATLGAWLGPRSPNSLILQMNRLSIGPALLHPKGGLGAVATETERAVTAADTTLRPNAPVARVIVDGDRTVGVILANGEEIRAGVIISAINPHITLHGLLGPRHLDAGFYKRTHHIRSRGGAAKLHLALNGTPDFRGADLRSRLVIAPSIRVVESSFNAVKYGEVPGAPVIETILPSAHEAGFSHEGCHTLSAIVQFAPHDPKAGRDAARAQMLENTLAVLESHAPGIRKQVQHVELLMPYDIDARYGMVGGNWHHGEMAVEQMLFLRPLPEAAQYATPLPGLWLAGAGNHPGGGVTGAAGWNAAVRIIREAAI